MVMCWVPGCNHYNNREKCRFFKFPKIGTKERKRWIKLIRRNEEPRVGAHVCNCHFKDGAKENGPEIFDWNRDKSFMFYSNPERRVRRSKLSETEIEAGPSASTRIEIVDIMAEKCVVKFSIMVKYFKEDTKLIKCGENSVETNYIKSFSFETSTADTSSYFKEVYASMKNKIYTVEMNFNYDDGLTVSRCTCP